MKLEPSERHAMLGCDLWKKGALCPLHATGERLVKFFCLLAVACRSLNELVNMVCQIEQKVSADHEQKLSPCHRVVTQARLSSAPRWHIARTGRTPLLHARSRKKTLKSPFLASERYWLTKKMRENPVSTTGFRTGRRDGRDARQVTGAAAGYAQRGDGGGVTKDSSNAFVLADLPVSISCAKASGPSLNVRPGNSDEKIRGFLIAPLCSI